jgi:hypothetical protein
VTNVEYPNEITNDNPPMLVEEAKKTKKKANIVIYSTVAIYSVIEAILLFIGFPAWTYFVIRTSPPMSTETALITSIVSFLIIYWMISFVLLDGIESAMKRILHVNYKEWVFGECVLIINYLRENDKIKAIKEVDNLGSSIRALVWMARPNSRNKMLSQEFKTIENGGKSIKRMLLYSTSDIERLFTRFALAFIHDQDVNTFFSLREIIREASLFGDMKSFSQRILGRLESYPVLVTIIWGIVSTVISIILAILLKINPSG